MDKIILKNLKFYGYHGVLEVEREIGQHFEIDLVLYRDLTEPGKKDDINDTIDYGLVFTVVERIVTGRKFKLLEAMAQNIADAILDEFNPEKVTVIIRKRSIPINGALDYIGVEITRGKE